MYIARLLTVATLAVCTLPAQLAGTYIINPTLPLTTVTFPSFADAVAALTAQGVAGPVEFLIYDDAGPYTESNSFTTNNVTWNPSDAVLVMTSWTGTSAVNRVTFRAAAGERPVLDAAGRAMGIFWGGADYVTVEGLEVQNAIFDGISLYAESQHGIANDPIIDRCRIHGCGGTAITIYGNSAFPANTLVQNCTMWHCQLTGAGGFNTLARFGYISTRRTNGTRIVHNTFFVDTLPTNSAASYCVLGGQPSSATEVPFAEISNNIIFKLSNSPAAIYRFNTAAGSSVPAPPICDSNCFFNPNGTNFAIYGNPATTAPTLLDWQIGTFSDAASIEADPVLRDVTADDFHLTALSPCIASSTVATGILVDADGQARTAPFDIGADEFSAADFALVGTGCAGTGGLAPELSLYSWPFLGNPTFTIGCEQLSPNQIVFLFGSLGVGPAPLPLGAGCEAYLDIGSAAGLGAAVSGPGGTTSFTYALPINPGLAGFNIGYQAIALDAGAALGFTSSNAVDVTFDF